MHGFQISTNDKSTTTTTMTTTYDDGGGGSDMLMRSHVLRLATPAAKHRPENV